MFSCFEDSYEINRSYNRKNTLTEYKKKILYNRFVNQVILYDKKSKYTEFMYLSFSIIVTIGSIILPALLSIQNSDFGDSDSTEEIQERIYWATWGLSLVISICNGLSQLLGLNKRYISYIMVREKMIAEGWMYLECSGDYYKTHEESR